MSDNSYICDKCGYSTNENVGVCPQCGKRLRSPKKMRRIGVLQVLIGLFLVGFMGTITFRLVPSLMHPGVTGSEGGFTGTAEQARMILGLFSLVIIFGFFSMVSGVWQIVTGKRNKWIFIFMIALFVILILFSWFTTNKISNANQNTRAGLTRTNFSRSINFRHQSASKGSFSGDKL